MHIVRLSKREIVGSLSSVYFCGGDCVEDVTSHLMHHLQSFRVLKGKKVKRHFTTQFYLFCSSSPVDYGGLYLHENESVVIVLGV